MNSARSQISVGGAGANATSALAIAGNSGSIKGETELWNGSSWTVKNDCNNIRVNSGSNGTATSALIFGGEPGPVFTVSLTEEWNGTNWSEIGDMNQARQQLSGQGTTTAGLASGGSSNTPNLHSETWDGTGLFDRTVTTTSD